MRRPFGAALHGSRDTPFVKGSLSCRHAASWSMGAGGALAGVDRTWRRFLEPVWRHRLRLLTTDRRTTHESVHTATARGAVGAANLLTAAAAHGNLLYLPDDNPLFSGSGLGKVNTVLTFGSPGQQQFGQLFLLRRRHGRRHP
jgi:hypothetical protein